jgi:hypothetical protein
LLRTEELKPFLTNGSTSANGVWFNFEVAVCIKNLKALVTAPTPLNLKVWVNFNFTVALKEKFC